MPRSKAEVRLAHAVLEGKAKSSGMSHAYAEEVASDMHGKKMSSLPDHTKPKDARAGIKTRLILRLAPFLLLPVLLHPSPAIAQSPNSGAPTRVNSYPTSESPTLLPFYDGSNNLIYLCEAQPIQTGSHAPTWAITPGAGQLTLTDITVNTNVATVTVSGSTIKLQPGNKVIVAGSTTAALNGSYAVATTPSSTTITFATSGVGDAVYSTALITLSATGPRSDDTVWSIQKLTYTGNNMTRSQWADGVSGSYTHSCDARTTQFYQ